MRPIKSTTQGLQLFIGDHHVPFHDPVAWDLIVQWVKDYRPEVIHHLGDFLDCYQLSSHDRDPELITNFRDDCELGHTLLSELREASPGSKFHLSEGNHEDRLPRYLKRKAPELFDTVPSALRLSSLDIQWHPQTHPYQTGKLWVKHGTCIRKHSGYTAKEELLRCGDNVIHGHTHRLGSHYWSDYNRTICAWENGCLCKIDPAVHQYTKGPPNWQQGFSIGTFHRGLFQLEQVIILTNQSSKEKGFLFNGKWYYQTISA